MASQNNLFCGVCDTSHITKCADYWCPECEEGFCSNCQSHHMASKATRRHGVISIDNYKKLPMFITEIVSHCNDHDMKYTNFCLEHDALCCPACMLSSHQACFGRIALLHEVIKASKTSDSLENIEQCCKDLKLNIDMIKEDRKHNLLKVEEQRKTIEREIQQLRVKLSLHLDKLEQEIINKLLAAEAEIKSRIEATLTELSTESNSINELHNNVLAVKEYASEIQTFFGIRTIETKIEEKEKFVQSLFENGNMQRFSLICQMDEKLVDILPTITVFGSIAVDASLVSITPTNKKNNKAQIIAAIREPTPMSINDINLTLHSTISIPETGREIDIRGCTICPENKMVFADINNGRLVILNDDGTFNKEISCCEANRGPYDVTSIDDRTVAVTTRYGIHIINIESNRTERAIHTGRRCYGITHHKGALIWFQVFKGIQMLELTEQEVITVVKQDTLDFCAYITTCFEKIYQTDNDNHIVSCFTSKGDKLWEFKDESVLKHPTSIAVDNNNNVYILSAALKSLVVLSPDGTQSRKLRGEEHGLTNCWALHYDITKNKLLVCSQTGSTNRYNISFEP